MHVIGSNKVKRYKDKGRVAVDLHSCFLPFFVGGR